MAIKLIGTTSGVELDVDTNKNVMISKGLPVHPAAAAGGYYTCPGGPAAIVAASLAADVNLASFWLLVASTRKAYVTKFRLSISPATLGVAAGVAGVLGLQRYTTAQFSGGTARTPIQEAYESLAGLSDASVQDLNSALTVGAATFPAGGEIAWTRMPHYVTDAGWFEWIFEPKYPVVVQPGNGISMRMRVVNPATQTWTYAYTWHWYEQ